MAEDYFLIDIDAIHEREDATLAPYAMRSSQSRGRQYPEPDSPYRSAFQRDRDRIIHSTAFRRLEPSDSVRLHVGYCNGRLRI